MLPRWDVLVREDGRRFGVIESVIDSNWLQAMENSVDPSHLYWLHGSLGSRNLPVGQERFNALGLQPEYEEENEFIEFEYGIMKRRTTPNPKAGGPPEMEQHPLVFPTYLRLVPSLSSLRSLDAWQSLTEEESQLRYVHDMDFRTPVDDTHTMEYRLCFVPSTTHMPADEDPPFEVSPMKDEAGNYRLDFIPAQDALAWESQGALTDRTREHLGNADRGIIMLRKLIRDQIEAVETRRGPDRRDPRSRQERHDRSRRGPRAARALSPRRTRRLLVAMQAAEPRYGIDPYEEWVAREGLPVADGLALDLFEVRNRRLAAHRREGRRHPVSRFGRLLQHVRRRNPGRRFDPSAAAPLRRDLLRARRHAAAREFESADGKRRSFEWGRGSFFAIPLNAKYRHFNGSGIKRALLATTTTLPIMINLFHNEEFIFNTPFAFAERIGKEEYYTR